MGKEEGRRGERRMKMGKEGGSTKDEKGKSIGMKETVTVGNVKLDCSYLSKDKYIGCGHILEQYSRAVF